MDNEKKESSAKADPVKATEEVKAPEKKKREITPEQLAKREERKAKRAAKADPVKVAADIHQLVGRVHRLKILIGRGANPDTIGKYQKELDAKEAALNKRALKHQELINKELTALGYVPK